MRLLDRIRSWFRRRPPTGEEVAARAEADVFHEQVLEEETRHKPAADSNRPL